MYTRMFSNKTFLESLNFYLISYDSIILVYTRDKFLYFGMYLKILKLALKLGTSVRPLTAVPLAFWTSVLVNGGWKQDFFKKKGLKP